MHAQIGSPTARVENSSSEIQRECNIFICEGRHSWSPQFSQVSAVSRVYLKWSRVQQRRPVMKAPAFSMFFDVLCALHHADNDLQ